MDAAEQHRHIAKLQRLWKTQAHKDELYNHRRAVIERNAGNYILARAYAKEAEWDRIWANRRQAIVNQQRKFIK